MAIFDRLYSMMVEVDRKGFNPRKENYLDRINKLVDEGFIGQESPGDPKNTNGQPADTSDVLDEYSVGKYTPYTTRGYTPTNVLDALQRDFGMDRSVAKKRYSREPEQLLKETFGKQPDGWELRTPKESYEESGGLYEEWTVRRRMPLTKPQYTSEEDKQLDNLTNQLSETHKKNAMNVSNLAQQYKKGDIDKLEYKKRIDRMRTQEEDLRNRINYLFGD